MDVDHDETPGATSRAAKQNGEDREEADMERFLEVSFHIVGIKLGRLLGQRWVDRIAFRLPGEVGVLGCFLLRSQAD